MISPDSKHVLISHESNDGLWILETSSNRIVKKLDEGTGPLRVVGTGSKIYQSQIFRPFVLVIDATDFSIKKSIWVGGRPMNLAVSPDGSSAYVPNYDLNEIEKIDILHDSVVARIPLARGPRGIAITPDGRTAYVSNPVAVSVSVVDLLKGAVVKEFSVKGMPTTIAVSPDGKWAYVSLQGGASIAVIDIATS